MSKLKRELRSCPHTHMLTIHGDLTVCLQCGSTKRTNGSWVSPWIWREGEL